LSLCDTGVDKSTIDNLNLGKGQFGRKLEYSLMCSTGQAFDLAYRFATRSDVSSTDVVQ